MAAARPRSELLFEVSNKISAFMAECFGRGPARARAFENDKYLFVVLEGVMTQAERTLVDHERGDAIRMFRVVFEDVTREGVTQIVEDVLGARVLDYMSQVLVRANVLVEIFVLDAADAPA
jgi:uncharacterized protein YbcI